MQRNQIDPLGKVADLHTSLRLQELGFAVETEKAWYQNGFNQIRVMTELEAYYDNLKNKTLAVRAVHEKLCPAPDFSEIWKELPKEHGEWSEDIRHLGLILTKASVGMFYNSIRLNCYPYERNQDITVDFNSDLYSLIENNNLAQAAAELWIKLKTENFLS